MFFLVQLVAVGCILFTSIGNLVPKAVGKTMIRRNKVMRDYLFPIRPVDYVSEPEHTLCFFSTEGVGIQSINYVARTNGAVANTRWKLYRAHDYELAEVPVSFLCTCGNRLW